MVILKKLSRNTFAVSTFTADLLNKPFLNTKSLTFVHFILLALLYRSVSH